VAVYDKYGCPARDTMNLTVFPVPSVNMIGDKLTCGKKKRKLELEYTGADPAMLANGKIIWKTDKPDKLTFKNSTNTSTDIEVTTWGEYNVSYVFTTPDGCETKNAHTLRFAEIPTSMIQFVEDPNDKCKGYSREIIYFGNASPKANYFWDYGNCLADSIDWNKRRVSVAAGNAKSVISLYVEEYGCWSDTSTLTMGANPAFVMNTAKSRGCDTATIQFSGELKIDDNLLFEWNFGDGSAINNLQTPKHFYSDTGKYDVTLKITNLDNQCFVGYTENEMVKIFQTPTAKIDLDPLFCNDSTVDAIYSFNIDSSFCYWKFEGAHQISIGNDSITAFLDKQIATIRLQVEEYGCKSKWAETTAKRKPFFDFSTDLTEGCQPLQVLAKATTADENIEFKWLTDSLITSGKEQNFILPDSGKYDFTLSSTSSLTGCIDTLVKQDLVLVHPKPVAQFEVDYPVAIIEHANLHFTNLTPDVDIFDWDFGDGFSSNEENPQHTFTTINKYPVELIVESDFGCIDTTMMEIEILPFNVYTPNAFRPDSDIPENREFMPVGVGVDPDVFQLLIFNRWGEIVFESNNPENKWDGTTKNSDPAPMGNYIWKAEFADIQGFQHSMKGQIMLIR
jgi:gliding motility-associated-like protein